MDNTGIFDDGDDGEELDYIQTNILCCRTFMSETTVFIAHLHPYSIQLCFFFSFHLD